MTLTPCFDPAPFAWIANTDVPWGRLVRFGPPGFGAYARLRFIPDPERPGQSEADVDLPSDHLPDLEQARRAVHVLGGFTRAPHDCFFAVWEGYSDVPLTPEFREHLVEVPHRRYALFRGPLDAVDRFEELGSAAWAPAFAWPADHAWCLASDVDPHYAGIGASRAARRALLTSPDLDVVGADPTAPQPCFS